MAEYECHEDHFSKERCRHLDDLNVCTMAKRMRCGRCGYGVFATIVYEELRDLGDWKVFSYKDGAIRATLRGRNGVVEVWGGIHRDEVWYCPRNREEGEVLITAHWHLREPTYHYGRPSFLENEMPLREAVEMACARAGIQVRLEL